MSTNQLSTTKTAKSPFQTPGDVHSYFGKQLLNTLLMGGAVGAGGMGLYHLAKQLKRKNEEAAAKPSLAEVATAPPELLAAKQAFDASVLTYPVLGAGVGSLIGALRAEKGKKLKGALTGAGVGGAAGIGGAALTSRPVTEFIGRNIPKSLGLWSAAFGDSFAPTPSPESGTQQALVNLGTIGAGIGGAYAGGKTVDSLLRKDEESRGADTVQSARDEYFKTLLGDDEEKKKKEKTAFDAALDAIYEQTEKSGYLFTQSRGPFEGWALNFAPETRKWLSGNVLTLAGLGMLGGGAVGAKYMYDKTKAKSDAKFLAAAAQARARANAGAPWMDPVELAQVKNLATQKELTHERGA